MDNITASVKTVCLVTAGICVLRNITEGTKLRSQADFVFRLIFAIVLVTPFIGGGRGFELPDLNAFDSEDHSFFSDIYDKELAKETAVNIEEILSSQLRAAGITVDEIRAEVNISWEGSISINRVIIRTAEFEKAADIIRSSLGQETEVVNGNS